MLVKLFRILTKLQYFMYMILSSEILLLMWNIDLSPIIIVALLCIAGICYNYFTKDGENETETFEAVGFLEKYFHLFSSIVALGLSMCILTFGFGLVSDILKGLLDSFVLIRYFIYGIGFPFVASYIITWCFSDIKPIVKENSGLFFKFLAIFLLFGLLVTFDWNYYITELAIHF